MLLTADVTVPDTVVQAVRHYDPDLRLRWGRATRRVRLERRSARARPLDPPKIDPDTVIDETDPKVIAARNEAHDDYECARDGYVPVFDFPPEDRYYRKLVRALYLTDIQRRGGADTVMDEIEEAAEKVIQENRGKFKGLIYDSAREVYDYANRVRTLPEKFAHTAPRGGMSINSD